MTPLGRQKSTLNKEKYIECIDNLFLKLELAYHYQFYKVFGTDDRLNEGKKLWAISLKSFSPEIITEATENVIGAQSYLPTLTDFLKACSEINSHNGFPSVEEAYIEARKSYAPRTEYPWSHPIVYFAGKKIGWNFLDEKDSKELFSSFKKPRQPMPLPVTNKVTLTDKVWFSFQSKIRFGSLSSLPMPSKPTPANLASTV